MLEHLHVKNVALIDEVEIEFARGLNILTGETGAGKSIVIDSINFLLGERPGKEFIRNGKAEAEVTGLIAIEHSQTAESIRNMGVEIGDDGKLLLWRNITAAGKGSCRANGRTITVTMLKEISSLLVDVHGQHQHQSLLNQQRHIELLDRFCGEKLEAEKAKLFAAVKDYREILKRIKEISGSGADRQTQIDMLTYQANEIEAIGLKPGEEEALLERKKILAASERLKNDIAETLTQLSEEDGSGALERISKGLHYMTDLGSLDTSKQYLAEELSEMEVKLRDVVRDLYHYIDGFEHDPEELNRIEVRLDAIYILKRKYGGSVEAVLSHYTDVKEKLLFIENSEAELKRLTVEKKKCGQASVVLCEKISSIRKKSAAKIKSQIELILKDLGMKSALFDILIDKKSEFNANGYDRVEFLISPNPGEPLKPLAKIASGGEMSRVMLALKTVLADADQIETFIFDEIDTGVSGRTAQMVAEKLAFIGRIHQILCITHLPQIASMGDAHFLIEKKSDEKRTVTTVQSLNSEQATLELARLIGGVKITEATGRAAAEMKQMAEQIKKGFG